VPDAIKAELEITFVDEVSEVLEIMLEPRVPLTDAPEGPSGDAAVIPVASITPTQPGA
jgi:hypothetical protein